MLRSKGAIRLQILIPAIFLPTVVWAHTGAEAASSFWHGAMHPLGGLDHILAMVAVGLFAATLGGRALWAVPLAFLTTMALGGAVGVAGLALPHVETAIALSVVLLGTLIMAHRQWSTAAAMSFTAAFAIFHGHAHGAEMPQTLSGAGYAFGFLLATSALHLMGIGAGLASSRSGTAASAKDIMRVQGAAIGIAGAGLLVGIG
jgi:urease accessory protein